MIRKLVGIVANDICNYNNYDEEKREIINYTLLITTFEIIKTIILLMLFSILGLFKEIFIVLLVMACTKPFMGGYHEDTQFKCLISTAILAFVIIYLSMINKLDLPSLVLINVINIFAIYNRAPVINSDMPITREDLINKNRRLAIRNSLIFIILALLLHHIGICSSIITWTLLIQVCLMFNKK